MKNSIKYIILFAVGLLGFTACDMNDPIVFTQQDAFVGFTAKSIAIEETDNVLEIPVMVVAVEGSPAITVEFDFTVEGLDNPAIEGVDFELLNESKMLSYPNGWGYDTIRVRTIDNSEFTGTKQVNVIMYGNSQEYVSGANDVLTINVKDDDHPLGWMLGSYTASGNLWRDSGPATWDMIIDSDPTNINQVIIQGLVAAGSYGMPLGPDYIVTGVVDMATMTMTIKTGQEIPTWGYGTVTLQGWYGPDGATDITEGDDITCDIVEENGAVSIKPRDEYGVYIIDGNNEGLYLELVIGDGTAVNTTWTRN